MFGQFLELAIATTEIAASVGFYERLGFTALLAGDAWPHHYGVFSDGRVTLGLHERPGASPMPTFVLPDLLHAQQRLPEDAIDPQLSQLGEERLNELRLRDPGGHAVSLLEARTYSPPPSALTASRCGYFTQLSLPEADFDAARVFWEAGGFVALSELDDPYPHLPLTSDHLDVAFHQRRTFDAALLVFECDLSAVRAQLPQLSITPSKELPRGLDPQHSLLLEAPEGTLLLLLQESV